MGDPFDSWLETRLKELEADDVFIPYIRGLLVVTRFLLTSRFLFSKFVVWFQEGEESFEEKTSSLCDLLASMGLEDVKETSRQVGKSKARKRSTNNFMKRPRIYIEFLLHRFGWSGPTSSPILTSPKLVQLAEKIWKGLWKVWASAQPWFDAAKHKIVDNI